MIKELVFEQIEGNFWYAAYGPFRVVMMKDTGYINATKMCSSGGKNYCDWSLLNSSHELINALAIDLALENTHGASASTLRDGNQQICGLPSPLCKFIQTRNSTDMERIISGIYIHPDLVPSVAGWISPSIQLMANRVVVGYVTMEYKAHLAAANQELDAKQLELEQATEQREADTLDARHAQQLREAATQDAHHAHIQRDSAILDAHHAQI